MRLAFGPATVYFLFDTALLGPPRQAKPCFEGFCYRTNPKRMPSKIRYAQPLACQGAKQGQILEWSALRRPFRLCRSRGDPLHKTYGLLAQDLRRCPSPESSPCTRNPLPRRFCPWQLARGTGDPHAPPSKPRLARRHSRHTRDRVHAVVSVACLKTVEALAGLSSGRNLVIGGVFYQNRRTRYNVEAYGVLPGRMKGDPERIALPFRQAAQRV